MERLMANPMPLPWGLVVKNATVAIEIVEIGKLFLLNQDLESDLPALVRELRGEIEGADAILLATPEYNHSYSPVIQFA
jgi:chromate reductase, NAD(P)H dehydrogenase (quinone)